MADIDLERALEPVGGHLVGAEQQHQLRLRGFEVGNAARLRVAEHQPGHARRRGVEDVEAVPAVPDQAERLDQRQRRAERAGCERARRRRSPPAAAPQRTHP